MNLIQKCIKFVAVLSHMAFINTLYKKKQKKQNPPALYKLVYTVLFIFNGNFFGGIYSITLTWCRNNVKVKSASDKNTAQTKACVSRLVVFSELGERYAGIAQRAVYLNGQSCSCSFSLSSIILLSFDPLPDLHIKHLCQSNNLKPYITISKNKQNAAKRKY